MPERSQMSSIMGQIEIDHLELFALEFGKNDESDFVYIYKIMITSQHQAWSKFIMGQMEMDHPELFTLEFGKIAESDFIYTLSPTNINQSTPNLVKMYDLLSVELWV